MESTKLSEFVGTGGGGGRGTSSVWMGHLLHLKVKRSQAFKALRNEDSRNKEQKEEEDLPCAGTWQASSEAASSPGRKDT